VLPILPDRRANDCGSVDRSSDVTLRKTRPCDVTCAAGYDVHTCSHAIPALQEDAAALIAELMLAEA